MALIEKTTVLFGPEQGPEPNWRDEHDQKIVDSSLFAWVGCFLREHPVILHYLAPIDLAKLGGFCSLLLLVVRSSPLLVDKVLVAFGEVGGSKLKR